MKMKKKIFVTRKPTKCPGCGSSKVAVYLYGMPDFSDELQQKVEAGTVVLGGCCITGKDPDYHCMDCNADIYKSRDISRQTI
jgi:hypothetical protein